ncbi:UTP--glucose-1-phosphate uridylyltransferase [Arcanobacterium ihumii]|uniref:UTP--glucose-1-phosphate uridylyltransferase n=1 Tax=Arcanobacterium ihumii TaxID=2138162 RepID=UPI001357E4E4|nr:UTP--glucose-1-phosphate uridylyltransferase [Arcanobacterium ihumii]
MDALDRSLQKLMDDGAGPVTTAVFESYFKQLRDGNTGIIPEDSIEPLRNVVALKDIEVDSKRAREALGKTVFLKLNGGLGTSMGLSHAKSLIPVRDQMTFLDIIFAQVRAARNRSMSQIPLIFMNSYRTNQDTHSFFPEDLRISDLTFDFIQNREPRLLVNTLEPVSWPNDPELEWCPPGHGNIYTCLAETTLLTELLEAGYTILSISNVDNLGAFPSELLASWFEDSGRSLAPEVCKRSQNDLKGGHLATDKRNGTIILRDSSQTSPEDSPYFSDPTRHPFFNTNNLWFNIEALRDLLQRTGGVLDLPLIRNRKHVVPADPKTPEVFQIECASGAIVSHFGDASPILVERDRFIPVKTTNDLFAIRSDSYTFDEHFHLKLDRDEAPTILLDSRYFGMISDFEKRTKILPSTKNLESLEVFGDYTFDGTEMFQGAVTIGGAQ